MTTDLISLGKTNIQISPLGLGTWQWGDAVMWGYGKTHTAEDTQAAFETARANGINWFDTAEVYGLGVSERMLGGYVRAASSAPSARDKSAAAPLVATKFFPFPWRITRWQVIRALRGSLRRLGLNRVDLYQLHFPPFTPLASIETLADALADVHTAGLARAVGVSNFNADQMLRVDILLQKRGIPLASNQLHYSLLNRKIEHSGLLQLCQERGVGVLAYSPIAKGILSGKYSPEAPPPGMRGRIYPTHVLRKAQPLLQRMGEIGANHNGKSRMQVALNWVICKGAVPILGAKNARHAEEAAGALGWHLTPDEVIALDELSFDA